MPLTFLLDEHYRGLLWQAIQHHNSQSATPLDVVRVGDPPDLPLRSTDPTILLWTEREGRLILTEDGSTMPAHLKDHLAAGRHSPGILIIRPHRPIPQIINHLVLVAYASEPWEWRDQHRYIP